VFLRVRTSYGQDVDYCFNETGLCNPFFGSNENSSWQPAAGYWIALVGSFVNTMILAGFSRVICSHFDRPEGWNTRMFATYLTRIQERPERSLTNKYYYNWCLCVKHCKTDFCEFDLLETSIHPDRAEKCPAVVRCCRPTTDERGNEFERKMDVPMLQGICEVLVLPFLVLGAIVVYAFTFAGGLLYASFIGLKECSPDLASECFRYMKECCIGICTCDLVCHCNCPKCDAALCRDVGECALTLCQLCESPFVECIGRLLCVFTDQ